MPREWVIYGRTDFDESDLPWSPGQEVMPVRAATIDEMIAVIDRVVDHNQQFKARFTNVTVLEREWRGHPPGARVLLEPLKVAIEAVA